MTLSRERRTQLAESYLPTYYPAITPDQKRRAVELAADNFIGNYSPTRSEQESRGALGSGVCFEEFVIFMGRNITGIIPVGVKPERLGMILRKVTSI